MGVIVYGADGCPPCGRLKQYLKDNNIESTYVDLTDEKNNQIANDIIEKTGELRIPIIDVDGETISGFNKDKLDKLFKKQD